MNEATAGEDRSNWAAYWAPHEVIDNVKHTGTLNVPHYVRPKTGQSQGLPGIQAPDRSVTMDDQGAEGPRLAWTKDIPPAKVHGLGDLQNWSDFTQITTFHGIRYIFDKGGFSFRK